MKSLRDKQRSHFFFLLLDTQFRNDLRKILDSEKTPRPAHRRDSHGSEPRIQNILAVAGRIHPAFMNDLGIRTDGDIFRDDAEARAGIREACFEARLVRKLVLEHIQIEHEEGVVAGGFEEGVVPLEHGEALRGAFAIQGLEELAF